MNKLTQINKQQTILISLILFSSIALFLFFLSMINITPTTFAETVEASTTFGVELGTVVTAPVISENPINMALNPGTELETKDITVMVGTNNPTGYTLSVSTDSADTDLSHKSKPATDYNNYIVPTLASETTATNFPENRWGISLDNGSTFKPMRNSSNAITLDETEGPENQHTTPVKFGVKANMDKVAGTYSNTLVFSVVTNAVPTIYSLAFDANGGTSGSPTTLTNASTEQSHTFTLPKDGDSGYVAPTKTNMKFLGWATDGSATTPEYNPGDTYTLSQNNPTSTLYAIYGADTFTFDVELKNGEIATYQAEKWMTLHDWVDSPYNTYGYKKVIQNNYEYGWIVTPGVVETEYQPAVVTADSLDYSGDSFCKYTGGSVGYWGYEATIYETLLNRKELLDPYLFYICGYHWIDIE